MFRLYKIHRSNVLLLKTADFKDADIVASLLDSICKELIRVTILVAQVNGLEKRLLSWQLRQQRPSQKNHQSRSNTFFQ